MALPKVSVTAETLDEVKARVAAEMQAALDEGYEILELYVPYEHSAALVAWVESESVRCGCTVEPGKIATLVINMALAPLPPKTAEQIQAEIDAALARTVEANALVERVAQLEALVAALQGGA